MTYPAYIREKARRLRRERKLTIDQLAERLSLSRTTIYYWVKDLPVRDPHNERATAARNRACRSMQRKHRLLREAAYEEGRLQFPSLSRDPHFRDFVCLYLAEGYKRNRNRAEICNSDPSIMRIAHRWLMRLASGRGDYRVHYHLDQDPSELQRFWARELRVEPAEIRFQPKSNSGQLGSRQWRCVHGVLTVGVNDTAFRARLEAWMDCLRAEWH